LFESRGIDDRHQSGSRVRDVDELAVRREGDPFGDRPGRSPSGAMNLRQFRVSKYLEIGQRIFEYGIGDGAVHPQRFAIWGDADSVRRSSLSSLSDTKSGGFIRQLNSGNFFTFCEINDCKAVEP